MTTDLLTQLASADLRGEERSYTSWEQAKGPVAQCLEGVLRHVELLEAARPDERTQRTLRGWLRRVAEIVLQSQDCPAEHQRSLELGLRALQTQALLQKLQGPNAEAAERELAPGPPPKGQVADLGQARSEMGLPPVASPAEKGQTKADLCESDLSR